MILSARPRQDHLCALSSLITMLCDQQPDPAAVAAQPSCRPARICSPMPGGSLPRNCLRRAQPVPSSEGGSPGRAGTSQLRAPPAPAGEPGSGPPLAGSSRLRESPRVRCLPASQLRAVPQEGAPATTHGGRERWHHSVPPAPKIIFRTPFPAENPAASYIGPRSPAPRLGPVPAPAPRSAPPSAARVGPPRLDRRIPG